VTAEITVDWIVNEIQRRYGTGPASRLDGDLIDKEIKSQFPEYVLLSEDEQMNVLKRVIVKLIEPMYRRDTS